MRQRHDSFGGLEQLPPSRWLAQDLIGTRLECVKGSFAIARWFQQEHTGATILRAEGAHQLRRALDLAIHDHQARLLIRRRSQRLFSISCRRYPPTL